MQTTGDVRSSRQDGKAVLAQARLSNLVERTEGRPDITVALLDGPVLPHPELPDSVAATAGSQDPASTHGTFVAGVLWARRESRAPALAPGTTPLIVPIFETRDGSVVGASLDQLADALADAVRRGARVVNISAATIRPSVNGHRRLETSLQAAARAGALIVAAVGNRSGVGSSPLVRHPAVLPVVASDAGGRPAGGSNLAASFAHRGLAAPGADVVSLGPGSGHLTWSGTSAAAPFVTGTAALLASLRPQATASELRFALTGNRRSHGLMPPALDGDRACASLGLLPAPDRHLN